MSRPAIRATAVYWSPYLILALFQGSEVVRIEAPRCQRRGFDRRRLRQLLVDFATRVSPEELVLEARTAHRLGLNPQGGQVRTMTMRDTKRVLLSGQRSTHGLLYKHLLAEDPSLVRFITLKRGNCQPSLARFWPTARLLAVAIGWAAFGPRRSDFSIYS